ncbi:hypothetical protein [Burkholderia pyrrocinia]|uniref:hypothetical protein n=1 Tax=Burkholderia pyrrocinia TaxID=60550 RepID=UPI002AB0CD90|nr:hypothetical protein [Burkholderia pyrrocinia]
MNTLAPDLARTLRVSCDACFGTAAVWPLVERAYDEPQRFYHTLAHLAELFAHLAPYRAEPLWPAIELAEWAQDPDAPSTAFRAGRKQALEQLRGQVPLFQSAEFAPLTPLAQRNLDTLIHAYA